MPIGEKYYLYADCKTNCDHSMKKKKRNSNLSIEWKTKYNEKNFTVVQCRPPTSLFWKCEGKEKNIEKENEQKKGKCRLRTNTHTVTLANRVSFYYVSSRPTDNTQLQIYLVYIYVQIYTSTDKHTLHMYA